MRNLKDINENININDSRRSVIDRTYYENKLTNNILYTKTSYVPTEMLIEKISDNDIL